MTPRSASKDPSEGAGAEALQPTVDSETGRYHLLGLPVWFMSPQYYADLQKQLEDLSGRASKGILYRSAFRSGQRTAEVLGDREPTNPGTEARLTRLLRLPDFAFAAGHGRSELKVEDLDRGETTWILRDSLIAELHGPSKEAACHFYSGFLAGFMSQVLGRPVETEEVECRARGDSRCAFRTRSARSLAV